METKPKILIVDDEETCRTPLKTMLELHSYDVIEADNGIEALKKLEEEPDAILLDLVLPDMYGIEVLKEITTKTDIPTIVVSVKDNKQDIDSVFANGGADYIIKPNKNDDQLIAKLKQLISERRNRGNSGIIKIGNIQVDTLRKIVTGNNKRLPFTDTEYRILEMFARNPNQIMENEYILKEIWGENYSIDENQVRWYIKRIRKKIERDITHPKILITEHGRGYILIK